jgi:hypothetical protein
MSPSEPLDARIAVQTTGHREFNGGGTPSPQGSLSQRAALVLPELSI